MFGSPSKYADIDRRFGRMLNSPLQHLGARCQIIGFQIQIEVLAVADESDGRIRVVDEFQTHELAAEPNPRVKVLILELEGPAKRGGIEADGFREVRGSQLRNDACDLDSATGSCQGDTGRATTLSAALGQASRCSSAS